MAGRRVMLGIWTHDSSLVIFVSFLVLHVFEERYFARNSLKMIQSKMHINLKDNFFYAVDSQSLRLHLKLSTTLLTLRQILFSFNWMNFTAIFYFSKRKWWHHYGENCSVRNSLAIEIQWVKNNPDSLSHGGGHIQIR